MSDLVLSKKINLDTNVTTSGGSLSSKEFNLTARNSPTSKVAGCKGFGLVQGLAPCA